MIEKKNNAIKILFIGNSFIYYNDLPQIVSDIAEANNIGAYVKHITYGGYRLCQYLEENTIENEQVLNELNNHSWDYVVLQEQSSNPYRNKDEFISSVKSLSYLIKCNGAKVILYSTWSYRDGSDILNDIKLTYTEMYKALTSAYLEAGDLTDSIVAPVGTAFYKITREKPELELLDADDLHPSLMGSFIAAYIFYRFIFGDIDNNKFHLEEIGNDNMLILKSYALKALKSVS